jgi:hypothetical protein
MASLSEFAQSLQTSPYEAFRQGGMVGQQADIKQQQMDIQQAGLAQQQKEIAGQQGAPMGLDKQATLAVPKEWTLAGQDGVTTLAGEINTKMLDGKKNQSEGQRLMNQAKYALDYKEKKDLYDTGRRLFDEGVRLQKEAGVDAKKPVSGLFYGLGTAEGKDDWDNTIKSYLDSGIPLPEGFPKEYSPENKKKVIAIAKGKDPEIAKKITNENRAIEDQQIQREEAKRKKEKADAKARDNLDGGKTSKVYETLDEKVNDPSYGVAKGKIPAKEQTVARRITTDSKEVTQGIDQVLTLTEGGMRDTTGTTFANVKDTGLLTAPAKFFTNSISDKDSAMYDAMMYPLVKGLALYTNPDYRPNEADVKNAMNAYKAQSGQPQAVQLEKLAELKKNYLSAAESFLDSNILNAQQANSLKQQIKYVQKAIPWDVKDVVNYTRSGEKEDFGSYLASKGKKTEKPEGKESAKPSAESKPNVTQEEYNKLKPGEMYWWNGKQVPKQ